MSRRYGLDWAGPWRWSPQPGAVCSTLPTGGPCCGKGNRRGFFPPSATMPGTPGKRRSVRGSSPCSRGPGGHRRTDFCRDRRARCSDRLLHPYPPVRGGLRGEGAAGSVAGGAHPLHTPLFRPRLRQDHPPQGHHPPPVRRPWRGSAPSGGRGGRAIRDRRGYLTYSLYQR